MELRSALPSPQFVLIVVSIAASAGLVFAADRFASRKPEPARLAAAQPSAPANAVDWEQTLARIQSEHSVLPPPPPAEAYQNLIAGAQSSSVTDTVSRSLLINLTNAGAQGLGSDLPTQDQLINSALAKLDEGSSSELYAAAELAIVADSPDALRAYGNAVMQTLANYPAASINQTFLVLGQAADLDDSTYFQRLTPIEAAYRAISRELVATPVPRTLSPLHLAVVNNFVKIADSYPDMRATPADPLRGLGGLHRYQSLTEETGRMFTTIAEQLESNAILFTEDEAGAAWSAFLPATPYI